MTPWALVRSGSGTSSTKPASATAAPAVARIARGRFSASRELVNRKFSRRTSGTSTWEATLQTASSTPTMKNFEDR